MSLLKALRDTTTLTENAEFILEDFKQGLNRYMGGEDGRDSITNLLCYYADYSYAYLKGVSETFKGNTDMKESLSFMNSVIAEICHELEIPYFHAEVGFSVVDKAVALRLDGNIDDVLFDEVSEVIDELLEAKAKVDAEVLQAEEEEARLASDIKED